MHFNVVINGDRYSVRNEELGGGVVDVVAFALRATLWAMNDPQSDDVLILDEPLKNLDVERMKRMGNVIHELSKSLNLQFIIVTHETELVDYADASFLVTKDNGVSHVEKCNI
jgi:DNA repair exonuclease SbcCD ATPase subunit